VQGSPDSADKTWGRSQSASTVCSVLQEKGAGENSDDDEVVDEDDDKDMSSSLRPLMLDMVECSSDATDPEMPALVPADYSGLADEGLTTDALTWEDLPLLQGLTIEREKPDPEGLSSEELEAETALQQAEALLDAVDVCSDDDHSKLEAVALLHQSVKEGCRSTVEAAVETLLLLFRVADSSSLRPVTRALSQCEEFPRQLAVNAARLLMLRTRWPGRDESVRRLCRNIALANPMAVVIACLDLVPRAPSKEMLGFTWLLDPLADQLAPSLKVGNRIVVVADFISDSKERIELKRGHEGEIREIDSDGDISVRFDGIQKRQWVFKRHSHRIGLASGNGDALPCAVTLLCDDAGGPPLCASSARALLMRLQDTVGQEGLLRQSHDEKLLRKARCVNVRETLKQLREFQNVSASE